MGLISAIAFLLCAPQDAAYRYFEDFDSRIDEPGYPGWEQRIDPQHPAWNRADRYEEKSEPSKAHSGRHVLTLRTYAGASAWKTVPGWLGGTYGRNVKPRNLPVDEAFTYRLTAWVRMPHVKKNRAQIGLIWRDRENLPIAEDRSAPLDGATGASKGAAEWTPLVLDVPRIDPRAVFVEIDLEFGGDDVESTCWFDDVELLAMPRILIRAPKNPYLIFEASKPVAAEISARVAHPESMKMKVWLADVTGTREISPRIVEPLTDEPIQFAATAPAPGYYEICAELSEGGRVVARERAPAAVLGPRIYAAPTDGEFGVTANPFTTPYDDLPALVDALGVDLVKYTVWDSATPRTGAAPTLEGLKGGLRDLLKRAPNVEIIGVMAHPPVRLFSELDPSLARAHIFRTFLAPEAEWALPLSRTLVLTREYVRRWQLGGDFDEARPDAVTAVLAYQIARAAILNVRSQATVGLSLDPAEDWIFDPTPSFVSFRGSAGPGRKAPWHVTRRVPPPPADASGVRWVPAVSALARDLTMLRAAKDAPPRIVLPLEALGSEGLLTPDGRVTPHLVAARTLIDLLNGARPLSNLTLFGGGAHEVIFDRNGETFAVAWVDAGEIEQPLHAGRAARLVTVWGEVTPLTPNGRVKVGTTPIFIVNVDRALLEFESSIAWDDPEVPLRRNPTKRTLAFTNTFGGDMTGVDILLRPAGAESWSTEPPRIATDLVAKGAALKSEIQIAPPSFSEAGAAPFEIEFRFRAGGQDYDVIATRPLQRKALIEPIITLADWNAAADTVSVRVRVKNNSTTPRSVTSVITIPGLQPIQASTYDLAPGATWEATQRTVEKASGFVAQKAFVEVLSYEPGGEQAFARARKQLE